MYTLLPLLNVSQCITIKTKCMLLIVITATSRMEFQMFVKSPLVAEFKLWNENIYFLCFFFCFCFIRS